MEPGWPEGRHRTACGDFGTATPDSATVPAGPVRCSRDAVEDTAVGHGKLAGKCRGARRRGALPEAGSRWGFLALAPRGGHRAGTQQGHNKCLLNLFSCYVWRPVALWAVATPHGSPCWVLKDLKVIRPECAGVRARHRAARRREPRVEAGSRGSGLGRARLSGCLGVQRVCQVGMGQAGGKFGRQTGPQAQALSCPDPMGTLDPVSRATFMLSPGA